MIGKILSLFVVLFSLGTVGYFGGLNFLPIDEGMALLPPQIRDVIDDIDDLVPNEIKKLAGNIDAENIATTVPSIPIIISDPTSFEEPDLKGQAPGVIVKPVSSSVGAPILCALFHTCIYIRGA